jgi:hypothetical protein
MAQINVCHIFVSKRVQQFQSLYKRNFCPGHGHLNLTAVYFRRCLIKQLKNSTFENLPNTIIEIGLTNCGRVDLSQIEIGFFSSFPYLTCIYTVLCRSYCFY